MGFSPITVAQGAIQQPWEREVWAAVREKRKEKVAFVLSFSLASHMTFGQFIVCSTRLGKHLPTELGFCLRVALKTHMTAYKSRNGPRGV